MTVPLLAASRAAASSSRPIIARYQWTPTSPEAERETEGGPRLGKTGHRRASDGGRAERLPRRDLGQRSVPADEWFRRKLDPAPR
jgi:hypothetical protein